MGLEALVGKSLAFDGLLLALGIMLSQRGVTKRELQASSYVKLSPRMLGAGDISASSTTTHQRARSYSA